MPSTNPSQRAIRVALEADMEDLLRLEGMDLADPEIMAGAWRQPRSMR